MHVHRGRRTLIRAPTQVGEDCQGGRRLIKRQSAREIAMMREAGRLVAECHAALAERIRPGVTTGELDRFV